SAVARLWRTGWRDRCRQERSVFAKATTRRAGRASYPGSSGVTVNNAQKFSGMICGVLPRRRYDPLPEEIHGSKLVQASPGWSKLKMLVTAKADASVVEFPGLGWIFRPEQRRGLFRGKGSNVFGHILRRSADAPLRTKITRRRRLKSPL